jgi:hypothetical protein
VHINGIDSEGLEFDCQLLSAMFCARENNDTLTARQLGNGLQAIRIINDQNTVI